MAQVTSQGNVENVSPGFLVVRVSFNILLLLWELIIEFIYRLTNMPSVRAVELCNVQFSLVEVREESKPLSSQNIRKREREKERCF